MSSRKLKPHGNPWLDIKFPDGSEFNPPFSNALVPNVVDGWFDKWISRPLFWLEIIKGLKGDSPSKEVLIGVDNWILTVV